MERLLDPKNDWAFKQIFGKEKNKNILINFLNTMLTEVESPIIDVEFLNVDTDIEIAALRQSIVDVLCKAEDGRKFIVEMQKSSDAGFIQRAVEYASRVYLNQRTIASKKNGDKGGRTKVRPVIFLAIMADTLFKNSENYLSHHKIQDVVTGKCEIKEMSFSFLELSKFHKKFENLDDDIDKWAFFLKNSDELSPERLKKIRDSNTVFGDAYKEIERSSYTPEQLLEYSRYELKEEEIETRIQEAEQEGEIRGEKRGIIKGRNEGLVEGELKGKIETARKMLDDGLPVDIVSKYTDLSIEEIERIVK